MVAAVGFLGDMTGWLKDVSSHWWFLAVILVIAFLDSVIPVVPSETTVIIGGVAVGTGGGPYPLVLVLVAGAVGAFLGDNMSYEIGHRASHLVERRAARKESTRRKLDWAHEQIEERGGILLITARFIPGGRTILTLSCGFTKQSRRWFAIWIAVATTIWACYAGILGYVFGEKFQDDHTAAFLLAFGCAIAVNIVIEVVRHFRKRMTAGSKSAT